jgi:hypothetical protein
VGHPLAVSVNRDEHTSAAVPAIFCSFLSSQYFQPPRSLHTWFSNDGHAAAHQSPIRIKAIAPCGAGPLAAFAAPENPLFPTVSNRGSRASRPHSSLASPIGDPTPCGSRYGRNELFNLGGIGAGVQSVFMVLPTHSRHCRRRPIDRLCSYAFQPKALAASNGVPSLSTW